MSDPDNPDDLTTWQRIGRALTFYFFFTVPGLVTMTVLGVIGWILAPWLWAPNRRREIYTRGAEESLT